MSFHDNSIVPIKIREDLTVFIQGIPHDFTAKEAKRVAAVVLALTSVTKEKAEQ